MSIPNVNLPQNNIINDVNPQLNIMNNINQYSQGEINTSIKPPEQNSSLDIFKTESNPQVMNPQKEDINSVINPSVFSSNINNNIKVDEPSKVYQPVNNGMMVDINGVKNNAEDIGKKEEKNVESAVVVKKSKKKKGDKFLVLGLVLVILLGMVVLGLSGTKPTYELPLTLEGDAGLQQLTYSEYQDKIGETITVTYKLKVTEEAINSETTKNSATLTYSNNTNVGTATDTGG